MFGRRKERRERDRKIRAEAKSEILRMIKAEADEIYKGTGVWAHEMESERSRAIRALRILVKRIGEDQDIWG